MSNNKNMTMADHAEQWWIEQGNIVPNRGTPEYKEMYEKWHAFAFANFEK